MDSLELNKDIVAEENASKVEKEVANEEKAAEVVVDEAAVNSDETPKKDVEPKTKTSLLQELRAVIQEEAPEMKAKVDALKQSFYKIYNEEQEILRREAIELGNTFEKKADEIEDEFKQLLAQYKQMRAAKLAEAARQAEENLLKKQHIIQQIKNLVEEAGNGLDVTTKFAEVKQLQQNWKEIGPVPETEVRELNKQFSTCLDQFYDLLKINHELREYDLRKNLECKTQLCEAAEALAERTDIVAAFKDLQQLHEKWSEIGPVARDIREALWNRFKEASTVINKKHQDYFDRIHKQEEENLQIKTTLCEKLEAIDTTELSSFKQWDEMTQQVTAIQEEWRKVGYAPRKSNQQIYERYRAACDKFFDQKSAFYKQIKSDLQKNLERKRSLCGEAEALKDSTDWKATTEKMVALQKQWKEIGAIPHKYADDLWKRFLAACDYFFEKKKENFAGQRQEETENLKKKKEIIEKIEALTADDLKTAQETLRALIAEFNAVGFVPFKEKNKIQERFKKVVDEQFDKLNVDVTNRRLDVFKSNLEDIEAKGADKLADERRRLLRIYDNLKAEIAVSENNIGFFSAKSKKSEKLLQELERKIKSLKGELKVIEAKINLIDEKMN